MGSGRNIPADEAADSFLGFARALVAKLRQWEQELGPPVYDDWEIEFDDAGARGTHVRKLEYEGLLGRQDPSLTDVGELARDCVRLHLEKGVLKPPQLTDPEGKAVVTPSLEQLL